MSKRVSDALCQPTTNSRGNAAVAVLVAIVLVLAGYIVFRTLGDGSADNGQRSVVARGNLADDEKSNIEIYNSASPSVVHITTVSFSDADAIGSNPVAIPKGSGSGFVWDQSGHVVTNYHVVQDSNRWLVALGNKTYEAKRVGIAPHKDLAVLKIDAPKKDLRPIAVGESATLQVGQKVFAIGNPFGLDQTFSTGVVSGLGRQIEAVTGRKIHDVIQTDAAINPGNSGGPLLDSAGRLIGVNTAIVSPSGAYAGIGFAVPADEVRRIVPQLIEHGKVIRPGLGVIPLADHEMERVKRAGVYEGEGVMLRLVMPDGAAAESGLLGIRRVQGRIYWGDIVTKIESKPIRNTDDLFTALERRSVGDTVRVTIVRDGEEKTVDVQLRELP